MVFSSLTFIFIFLPIILVLYFIIPKKKVNYRNFVLLIMSLLFYSWGEPKYILLMLTSIIINYFIGLLIEKYDNTNIQKKIVFIFSIVFNVGLLIFFKYTDFLIGTVNSIFSISISKTNILLPIGISFYTFQIFSYVIDVYRGEVKSQKNILKLATYISLFPQLIAGPIVRYTTIEKELDKRDESLKNFGQGLRRFIIGLAKKVIIANNVALFADSIFNSTNGSFGTIILWLALIAYALQIYFDFSGYSDMAIGLGKMFGFNFLENFNYPYIATSITDFWRRWHISLSTWFRDYVYIPLGGNRVSNVRWYVNILIVWFLTGLWHGASWNFVLWGLYYGAILIIEKKLLKKVLDKSPKIIRHIYTIILILIGWLIFRIENVPMILNYLKTMFVFKPSDFTILFLNNQGTIPSLPYIPIGIICSLPFIKKIYSKIESSNKIYLMILFDLIIFALFILSLIYLISSKYNPFIYFRF